MAKENPYEVKALTLFYEDCENPDLRAIENTPQCKAVYLRAFSLGLNLGMNTAGKIYQEEIKAMKIKLS